MAVGTDAADDAAVDGDGGVVTPWESNVDDFVIEEGGENKLFNRLFFLSMDSLSAVLGLPGGNGSSYSCKKSDTLMKIYVECMNIIISFSIPQNYNVSRILIIR